MTKELLQMALDALEDAVGLHVRWDDAHADTITALREALAAPQPEPVIGTKTWFEDGKLITMHLTASDIYKAPPAAPAPAVPLTPNQKQQMWVDATIELPSPMNCYLRGVADAEQAHGIGGGGNG